MTVPGWVQDAIFYHIFPDRFANGDLTNDPPNVQPWGSPPTTVGFQGGDLRGIINHFDYLQDMGVTALYLNPIFLASSNHRYNTTDYFRIDPKLGDMKDFLALLDLVHRNGMHLILDGVFNHSGRGFFAFNDILENQEASPYQDWFHIKSFPVDAYSHGEAEDYLAWWGIKSLPKFNTDNPSVRRYLLDIARYWIELGADGWRLDVPNEIDDDSFWAEFRHTVKSVNPEAYLVGEIWNADPRWVGDSHFDGLLNYPVRDCLLHTLSPENTGSPSCFRRLESLLHIYPRENAYAMYIPLGSHDTERVSTKLDEDVDRVKLAMLFQFAYPGAPAVFYGDEIGLPGGKDPDCRGAFRWDETFWNLELRDWVKTLIRLRKHHASLRRGDYLHLLGEHEEICYAFARTLEDEQIAVVINPSSVSGSVRLPVSALHWGEGQTVKDLLTDRIYIVSSGHVTLKLPPWSGVWLGISV